LERALKLYAQPRHAAQDNFRNADHDALITRLLACASGNAPAGP
jgi:hypothetical protein